MSESLLKDTKCLKELRTVKQKNTNILDIVLFGSSVRGKARPRDMDVLVLFSGKVDMDIISNIRKTLKKYKAEITWATYADLMKPEFLARESFLTEGISLFTKRKISESFGFLGFAIIKYSLQNFSETQRTRFFYALRGRKDDGILEKFGYRIAKDVLLIRNDKIDEFREFLEEWKVRYIEIEALIPERRIFLLKKIK